MTQAPALTEHMHDGQTLKGKAQVAKTAMADLACEAKDYAAERLGNLTSSAREKMRDSSEAVVDFVQRKPYQSLAIAAGVGLLLGLILKRR